MRHRQFKRAVLELVLADDARERVIDQARTALAEPPRRHRAPARRTLDVR
jgi:hypothetical protein